MSDCPGIRQRRAFTLIELLVVVAIIALLIAILLPSLSTARAQARTTLCLSRISQLGKALLIYADDFNDTFPFVAMLHEKNPPGPDPNEIWLADWLKYSDAQAAINTVCYQSEDQWGDLKDAVSRSGILFAYTRFEILYRCPEFERQTQSRQHVFNYTRALWSRFWRLREEYIAEGRTPPSDWGGLDGPILKITKVYAPADLPLILDEQWNRHVGTAGEYGGGPYNSAYNCGDYAFFGDNIIAIAHGQPVTSPYHNYDYDKMFGKTPLLWKRGGIVCYDGHAELRRDPWPSLPLGNNRIRNEFRMGSEGSRLLDEMKALPEYMKAIIFAQRGFDPQARFGKPPVPW